MTPGAMHVWLSAVFKVHPEAGVQRVGGRLLVAGADDSLHTFEDDVGRASEVAERIVELSDGRRTLGEVVDALCAEFEVDRATCEADAVEFVKLLLDRNILVRAPEPPGETR